VDRAHGNADAVQSWEKIPGWFDWARFYEEQVRALPHRATIVEVGSFLGRSITYLAQTMKWYRKDLRLVAVDTFIGSESDPIVLHAVAREGGSLRDAFEAYLRACDVQDCIEVMTMESVSAAQQFADRSVDVVLLDGDHSYAGLTADLLAWLPKVKPWGYLAGHDIATYASVGQAIADMLGYEALWVDYSQNLWLLHNTPENQKRLKPKSQIALGL
jgi:predicted O-methyltransferase YrrM